MFSGGTASAARSALRFGALIARTRTGIQDLSVVAAVTLAAGYLLFEIGIFSTEGQGTLRHQEIELDEVLILGGVLTFGLLVFAVRRLHEQQQEMRRRAAAERSARELALRDALTGLPNRRRFDEALKAAVGSPPGADAIHAVMMVDLNGFKEINDVYGHAAGDEALCVVGRRLATAVRDGDMVARFGGDEFAVLALHLAGAEAATGIALRMLEALGRPIVIAGISHDVGAGIGICMMPRQGADAEEVLRRADVALYRAKAEETSALRFFDEEMDRHIRERDELQRALRAAMDAGVIRPLFQPLVDLQTKAVVAFEALPHWERDGAVVPPERFMSIAEDCGLIHELAERLLRSRSGPRSSRRPAWDPVLQRLALTGEGPHDRPPRARGPGRDRPAAASPGARDPGKRAGARHGGGAGRAGRVEGMAACGSRSTSSAPAIRASTTCRTSSWTASSSTGVFSTGVLWRASGREGGCRRRRRALLGLGRGLGLTVTAEGDPGGSSAIGVARQRLRRGQGGLGAAVRAEAARALCEPAPARMLAAAVAAG